MSKYKQLIENCFKEYNFEDDDDDLGDKTWTTSAEWRDYYNKKRQEKLQKPTDKVRVACISRNIYDDKIFRKLYVKEPTNGFDKTFEEKNAKIFDRYEAEKYINDHPEQIYPKEQLRVTYEIESV